ncbi:hypothetical protein [Ilumatobacter sp.]|uniref:hypothetical protein n=1 Tax=Ilumatobacter sp. TaxID=1967498 RepID=UPI003B51638F
MAFEDTDRRRTVFLALVTILALPALYVLNRTEIDDGSDGATAVVTDGSVVGSDDPGTGGRTPSRPPIEAPDDEPVFMDGGAPRDEPRVAEVAVPARPESPPAQMDASFRRTIGESTCPVLDFEAGVDVDVTNLDNGRTIECTTTSAGDDQVAGIVLGFEAFSRLADPTEAPIPVDVVRRS